MDTSQNRSKTSTPRPRSVRESTSGTTNDPPPPGSWPDDHADNNDRLSSSASIQGTELASGTTTVPGDPQSHSQDQPQLHSDQGAQRQPPPQEHEQRRRQSTRAPHRGRYEPNHPNYRLTRGQLRDIASTTLEKLDLGFYVPPPFKTMAEVEAEEKLKAEVKLRAEEEEEERAKREAGIAEEKDEERRDESIQLDAQLSVKKQYQDGSEDGENEAGQDCLQGLDEARQQIEEEKNQELPIYSSAYDLSSKIQYTEAHTEFYAPDDPYISNWSAIARPDTATNAVEGGSEPGDDTVRPNRSPGTESSKAKTRILIREYSTLVGARRMHDLLRRKRGKDEDRVKGDENDVSLSAPHDQTDSTDADNGNDDKIGILNFASAKKPGGGFINGSQAQEESLARTSTLYPSLITHTAAPFYEHYNANPDSPTAAYYTHAMVYSPSVILFRNDKGLWMSPIEVDILTSAAVNAGEVRERVRWEEEMREVRERWEKAEEEKRMWEEEERRREEDDWETVLKENEEMKRRFGDGEKVGEEKDAGKKEEGRLEETVESTIQDIKDETIADVSSGYSRILSTSSIDHQSSEKSIPAASSVLEKDTETISHEAIPPASQHAESEEHDQTTGPEPAESESEPKPDPMALVEVEIETQMYERIARILALFATPSPSSSTSSSPASTTTKYIPRTPHLILGSFGTGVFQNNIPLVARIFYDLLARRGAPFAGVFKTVVFAILGTGTVNIFREVFAGHGDAVAATGVSTHAEDDNGVDEDQNVVDEWVEIVKEGEDEDETALEQEEEAGCEQEGVLEPVEAETIPEHARADEAHEDGKGDDIVIDVDNADNSSTVRREEVEMLDGTHGDVDADPDVEMIYTAEDVHVHPQELFDQA